MDKAVSDGHTIEETAAWFMTRKVTKKMDHIYASPMDGMLMVLENEEEEDIEGDEVSQSMKIRLKAAFHALARKYHPDKNQGNKKFEDKLKTITLAYSQLKKTLGKK